MDVISIDGTSREDVWMLAVDTDGNATLVRYDGKKVVERYARPCGWVGSSGSLGIRFSMVRADARQVHVLASYREPDSRVGGDLTASLDRRTKRWTCAQRGVAPIRVASHGDFTWKLEDPAMGNGVCRLHAVDGPCLPTPWWSPSYNEPSQLTTDYGVWSTALWMGGLDDGWIANGDERGSSWLFRFNGVAWSPVAVVGKGECFTDVWADDSGVAYAIVTAKNDGWIVRIEGHDTRSIATPMGFDATRVWGTGPRDVWFFGPKHVYQWDGQRLHEMATNVFGDSDDVWGSPGGELWIVGGRVVSHTEALR